MTYKGILLSTLLMPYAIIADNSVDIRIEQLEEKSFQKELELSRLGDVITEKCKFLSSFVSDSKDLFKSLLSEEVNKLEKKNGKTVSKEEVEGQLSNELNDATRDFFCTFVNAAEGNKSIKGELVKLFQLDETDIAGDLGLLKFRLIRYMFERGLLVDLVQKYENCLQELIEINIKLENLKKQQ